MVQSSVERTVEPPVQVRPGAFVVSDEETLMLAPLWDDWMVGEVCGGNGFAVSFWSVRTKKVSLSTSQPHKRFPSASDLMMWHCWTLLNVSAIEILQPGLVLFLLSSERGSGLNKKVVRARPFGSEYVLHPRERSLAAIPQYDGVGRLASDPCKVSSAVI